MLSSGLGGNAGYWFPQLETFGQNFQVLTYDQRGTGRSAEVLSPTHDIPAMADDALQVLDRAGIGQCHFVGHALGGLIGLDLARRAPHRLLSLTVVNGWARIDAHTARCFAVRTDLLRDSGVAAFVRAQPIFLYPASWLADNTKRMEAEEAHALESFQGASNWLQRVTAAAAFDISADLSAISTRTLILAAHDDVLVPYQNSAALADGMPRATLNVMPTGGHAMNVTEPVAFNTTVLDFLRPTAGHRDKA